ncbi:hypothetical protein Asal01_01085 [Fodinibius salicampi]
MTDNPDDYRAVSRNSKSYNLEDVFKNMTREGSTVTTAEAMAVFEEITRGIIGMLEEGHAINTPLFNISSSITGVFEEEEDRFDPNRHQVQINLNSGVRLKDLSNTITPERVEGSSPVPTLKYLQDNISGTQNELLTPGGGARIRGARLKYDHEDSQQGIFFIHTGDQTEHRVDFEPLRNMPQDLIFTLPDLPAGEYEMEVRCVLKSTSDIRTGSLPDLLTVEP